jgi:DNA mismatch repair ATPase MutL
MGSNTEIIFQTGQNSTFKDNLIDLFSAKSFATLIPFNFDSQVMKCKGYISKIDAGKSANDRLFTFVNGRPCDLFKVYKVLP